MVTGKYRVNLLLILLQGRGETGSSAAAFYAWNIYEYLRLRASVDVNTEHCGPNLKS